MILESPIGQNQGHATPLRAVQPIDVIDATLLRGVLEGEHEAFRELFRRYGASALSLAYRLVRNKEMAEDATQEAFLSVWGTPWAYRAELGSVRAWLMATVHHRAVDKIRREEAHSRRRGPAQDREVRDLASEVAEILDLPAERAAVRAALVALPPAQREVLEMMYFGHMRRLESRSNSARPWERSRAGRCSARVDFARPLLPSWTWRAPDLSSLRRD